MKSNLPNLPLSTDGLITAIKSGEMTSEQVEMIATRVRLGLASSLMDSVDQLNEKENAIQTILLTMTEKLSQKVIVDLESGLLDDFDTMLKIFKTFSDVQNNVTEIKRRVFNGKDLFSVDPIPPQDRALLDLFKLVDTEEKKEQLKLFITNMTDMDDEFKLPV